MLIYSGGIIKTVKKMKTTYYYMAGSKKEAIHKAKEDNLNPKGVEVHKRIIKGTTIYKIIQ